MSATDLIETALAATHPSRHVAFRREFWPVRPGAWPELVKDIVAIANSGGGAVVVGVNDDGTPSGWDPAPLLSLDAADVTEHVSSYVGERFALLQLESAHKGDLRIAVIVVPARTDSPLVFEKAGTYDSNGAKDRVAFAKGTVYFRHGRRSEPARAKDLAHFAEHEARRMRADLMKNVRKVSHAPAGSEILIVTPKSRPETPVERFRIVDDPDLPAVARTDFDITHPYRQTELIKVINERAGEHLVGSFEMLCVRRVHDIEDHPEFFHKPKFGSPQYSDAFVTWILDQHRQNPEFFQQAKDRYRGR